MEYEADEAIAGVRLHPRVCASLRAHRRVARRRIADLLEVPLGS